MQCTLSGHNEMKLPANDKKIPEKSPNTWKVSNTLLNYPWVKEETRRDPRKYFELNEKESTPYKICGMPDKQ